MSQKGKRKVSRGKTFSLSPIMLGSLGGITLLLCIGIIIIRIPLFSQSSSHPANSNGSQTRYDNQPDRAFYTSQTARIDTRKCFVDDTVLMPNGLKLKVTGIQRNWQPPAAVSSSYGNTADGDNPNGREIIAIWFQATNVSTTPIVYNDSMFTLQTVGKPEQRVAHLSSLLPSSFGDRGVEPWLLPGQSKDTFVPFLVTPDATLESFQYYLPPSPASASNFTLVRLTIFLQPPVGHVQAYFIYKANKTITVGQ